MYTHARIEIAKCFIPNIDEFINSTYNVNLHISECIVLNVKYIQLQTTFFMENYLISSSMPFSNNVGQLTTHCVKLLRRKLSSVVNNKRQKIAQQCLPFFVRCPRPFFRSHWLSNQIQIFSTCPLERFRIRFCKQLQ